MIKLAKLGLLSVALLTAVVANASKIITVNSPGAKVVNITLAEVSQGEVLSIIDTEGNKLFEETLYKASTFTKTLNFAPLSEGVYFLETKKAKEVNVTPILVKKDNVSIVSNLTKTITAPKITTDGKVMKVLVKNFDALSVSISIYNEKGDGAFDSTDKNLLVYRAFDFSNLKKGTYTVSVTQGDYNFKEEVTF